MLRYNGMSSLPRRVRSDLLQLSLVGGSRLAAGELSVELTLGSSGACSHVMESKARRGPDPDWQGERFDGEFPDHVDGHRLRLVVQQHGESGREVAGEGQITLFRDEVRDP